MSNLKHKLALIFLIVILAIACHSQADKQTPKSGTGQNRQPAVSGQFYPADPDELLAMLNDLFANAEPRKKENVQALIVPHAGYIFSGHVAASGYNQLDMSREVENVFLIASSHRAFFEGASIYSVGNYLTPLGEVKVNHSIVDNLLRQSSVFSYRPEVHNAEHSLEVQLPFLQYLMTKNLQIVPIVIGTQSKHVCSQIAEYLKPYFNQKNLFVISSDFAHYPSYEDATVLDERTAAVIMSNSSESFLKEINDANGNQLRNLATRACGWTSLLTLLYLTEGNPNFSYQKILYENSGDSDYGDDQRVVGYYSLVLVDINMGNHKPDNFYLTDLEKRTLLEFAREAIIAHLNNENLPEMDKENLSGYLIETCGAFVTLHHAGELRGCIGTFTADKPLYRIVQDMAVAAAFEDRRFLPVGNEEIEDIDIEISVLTPMKKISSVDEIVLGEHGIYIKKGNRSGTFLPQVATETKWSKEEFLGYCSRDKAGIGWDGWKEAEIFTYRAIVFSE